MTALFALALMGFGPQTASDSAVFGIFMSVVAGVAASVIIDAVACGFLFTAQRAIPEAHRRITPGQVWLLVIPVFNLLWNFYVFMNLAESYRSYLESRGRSDVGDAGQALGLWYSILVLGMAVPCMGILLGLAAIVVLFLFISRIFALKRIIAEAEAVPSPREAVE